MKKLTTTLYLCLISVISFSQTFTVTDDTLNITSDVSLFPSDYIYFTNTSGGQLDLSFDVIYNTIPSAGWSATLCTDIVCMPTIPTSFNFGIYANGAQGYLNMHVDFNNTIGTGEIGFKVYETTNPTNFRIVYFIYTGTSTTGVSSNFMEATINTFPNPTTDILTIKGLETTTNGSIKIFNLTGNLIYSKNITSTNHVVDVSNFTNGMYLLEIKNQGNSIFNSRFIKK